MRKQIQKYGNSCVIRLSKDDLKIYNLKVGDIVDVEIEKVRAGK